MKTINVPEYIIDEVISKLEKDNNVIYSTDGHTAISVNDLASEIIVINTIRLIEQLRNKID